MEWAQQWARWSNRTENGKLDRPQIASDFIVSYATFCWHTGSKNTCRMNTAKKNTDPVRLTNQRPWRNYASFHSQHNYLRTDYQDAVPSVESTGQQCPSMHWEACSGGASMLHWSDGVNMIYTGLIPLVHKDPPGAAHTQKHTPLTKHDALHKLKPRWVWTDWTHSWLRCTPTHSRPMSLVLAFLPTASSTCTNGGIITELHGPQSDSKPAFYCSLKHWQESYWRGT